MIRFIDKISDRAAVVLSNYTLLALLFTQFFIIPFFPVEWHKPIFTVVITLIYLNLVVVIVDYRKSLLSYVLILILLDAVFIVLDLTILGQISEFLNILLFVFIVVKFLIIIAKSERVNIHVIMNSINGYFLLGILSTMMIKLVISIDPEAFAFNEAGILTGGVSRISEFQYYALVTLSTLGYGEITPITPSGRSIATMMAVSGQMYVAIIVALLVGKFSSQSNNNNE